MFATKVSSPPLAQGEIDAAIEGVLCALIPTGPTRVFLFGSAAQGTTHAASDLDFLLVYANTALIRAARGALRGRRPLARLPVDLIWVTASQFEAKKHLGGVCFEATHFGIELSLKSEGQ